MKPLRSIRWRLQIWYGLLLGTALAGFGITAFHFERVRRFREIDEQLQQRVSLVASSLRPSRSPSESGKPNGKELHLRPENVALFDSSQGGRSFYYVFWLHNGVPFTPSSTAPVDVPRPADIQGPSSPVGETKPDPGKQTTNTTSSSIRMRGMLREMFVIPQPGDCVLVGCSIAADLVELQQLAWLLAGAGGIVLALCLVGGWWLTTRAMRPIHDISAAAVKIAAGSLSERINSKETDSELGELAAVLNATFSRLEAAFAQQARFTADAAHELRTPVTVLLTHTQSALETVCPVEEHQEAFGACHRAARRMRRLIESLMELTRLDSGQEPMNRQPFDLAVMAADCIELVTPLTEARHITIQSELGPADCQGDPDRLAQVVTNLLVNAIQYNKDGGEVRVTTRIERNMAQLTVSDRGPGILPEHLPHIFERFYRADKARTAAAGNAGLGLAISKGIVEAHGGTITVSSQPGHGARFTIELPYGKS